MKIVEVITLVSEGKYPASEHWHKTRNFVHGGITFIDWPIGSGKFTIHPESGKGRGMGNGVGPIKESLLALLGADGWTLEGKAKNALGKGLGAYDAVLAGPSGPVVVEWETGHIGSSYRSISKLLMLLGDGVIAAGTVIMPNRKLAAFLTDRVSNVEELSGYWPLWRRFRCDEGVLEIVAIEHDAESFDVPKIPKSQAGRARD